MVLSSRYTLFLKTFVKLLLQMFDSTTIAPGAVETELLSHTTSQEIKRWLRLLEEDMGGVLAADDIIRAVSFAYQQPQNVCIH
ncbi:hypothetical protein O9992_25245 [Vibrio lentus]|nr:hypothetical protein [Vibrio lentus]